MINYLLTIININILLIYYYYFYLNIINVKI